MDDEFLPHHLVRVLISSSSYNVYLNVSHLFSPALNCPYQMSQGLITIQGKIKFQAFFFSISVEMLCVCTTFAHKKQFFYSQKLPIGVTISD